jgi:hypothetical protein
MAMLTAVAAMAITSGALLAAPAATAASAATAPIAKPMLTLHGAGVGPDLKLVTSTNWSGYADLGKSGSTYTTVSGTWTQNAVTCTSSSVTQWVYTWVGIDGYHSGTVEQLGTGVYCDDGSPNYFTWWEMYPKNPVEVSEISPGTQVIASVSYNATTKKYKLAMTSPTSGIAFTKSEKCGGSSCVNSSAEWIVESPASSMPNYGTETFSNASTTSGGTAGPISGWKDVAITMINSSSSTLAKVSALNSSGNSFGDTWVASS